MPDELEPRPSTDLSLTLREPVSEMLNTMAGSPPARETGRWIGDIIRGRRAQTQVRVLEKTLAAIEEANLPLHVVPDRTLVPLLEFAGLEDEDDDDILDMWANLLANAATPSSAETRSAFVEVLRQLEPIEARALDYLAPEGTTAPSDSDLVSIVKRDTGVPETGLDNLERLGLIRYFATTEPTWEDLMHLGSVLREAVGPTAFGIAFLNACRPPEPPQVA